MVSGSLCLRSFVKFIAAWIAWGSLFAPGAAVRAQDNTVPSKKSEAPAPAGSAKLRIIVVNPKQAPVANASVYVRFNQPGGEFHRGKLAEMNFKTNQDGSVKVPPVPQGKVEIQVIATGWHTFGQWFDVNQDEQTITVKLEEPPHWY